MAVAAAMFCLSPAAVQAQSATPALPAAKIVEIREGTGDIMPALGTNTKTQAQVKADTAGADAASAREYTVAPGEETHPPVRLTPDRTEMIHLDDDASSIIIGNPAHVNILLNNPRALLLAPRQPGATQFTVLNAQGKVVMQRHVIVSGPKENYVRIRRTCIGGGSGCQPTTVYYCPDICHDVRLLAGQANNNGQPGNSIPASASDESAGGGAPNIDGVGNGDDEPPLVTSDEAGENDTEDDNNNAE